MDVARQGRARSGVIRSRISFLDAFDAELGSLESAFGRLTLNRYAPRLRLE